MGFEGFRNLPASQFEEILESFIRSLQPNNKAIEDLLPKRVKFKFPLAKKDMPPVNRGEPGWATSASRANVQEARILRLKSCQQHHKIQDIIA